MRKIVVLSAVLLMAALAGCGTPRGLYYWGDYSSTLYAMKKNPDEKTIKEHTEMLNKIITYSEKFKKRVPPGICCEYGYMLLKAGNEPEARKYFEMEVKLYPESKLFVEKLIADIEVNKEKISENTTSGQKESK